MHRCVKILSPAKVNLFLEVIGQRRDGFHEIKTVLQEINLCDELTVRHTTRGITVHSDVKGLPLDRGNLVYQAAQLFLQDNNIKSGVEIQIVKRIPISGGLGGGSSNAACTLLAMDKLFGPRTDLQRLLGWAEKLGSDVPFFIRGVPSLAIGRGTELVPLRAYLPFWGVLAGPKGTPSPKKTAHVYDALNIGLTNGSVPVTITIAAIETKDVNALAAGVFNRLERIVLRRLPLVREIRHFMKTHGAKGVMVSGAGPTVFGIVPDRAHGVQISRKLSQRFGERVYTEVMRTLAGTPPPVWGT